MSRKVCVTFWGVNGGKIVKPKSYILTCRNKTDLQTKIANLADGYAGHNARSVPELMRDWDNYKICRVLGDRFVAGLREGLKAARAATNENLEFDSMGFPGTVAAAATADQLEKRAKMFSDVANAEHI